MKLHQIDQRSEDWFEIRRGKMTASNAQSIASNGKGLETYIYSLLAEKYSNNREIYTNSDIERGIELEDQARMTYEIEREKVEQVGFIELDELVGCSPDGLVGEDGGLEIKCVNDTNFFKVMVNGKNAIDTKYIWQAQMCMYVSGRKWWDIVFYNTNFDRNMLVFRITPNVERQEKIKVGIEKGKELINELETKYKKIND
ncbi:MAG: YqaJ viral recombinase family protein [Patescibacteria group bacterium]|nr:YqaJ viral recombinase family protein [Patescibacteria group bacterium]